MQAAVMDSTGERVAERAEHRPYRVRTLLRPQAAGDGWCWNLDPYEGCELGCLFCHVRLDRKELVGWREFERRVGVKVNAPEVLRHELRTQDLEARPIVLGGRSEPWQAAEERYQLTRRVLGVLADEGGVTLRAHTRSRLVARDASLLRAIADGGQVSVTLSVACGDEGLSRLLEPRAPPVAERLAAVAALARAGLRVGLLLSPALPGMPLQALGVEALLARAAAAGAAFAGLQPVHLGPGQRDNFLAHASLAAPSLLPLLRHAVSARPSEEEGRLLEERFEEARRRYGLAAAPTSPLER